ncbi:DUF99 family protein [Candidatus Thorarchaeota archaeon]|uniref:UPF0215 protein EU537_03525 n=1 Tax=Thorarchaeota archaeon (strain OWC) TaxID=2053491 RepID=A0A524EN15_THOAR|nr:MAG: DUF99 family protein [Candidatus Thorarchaeota archaeon]
MNEHIDLGNAEESDDNLQWKRGVRVLGVAESFEKDDTKSHVSGVIMRGDLRIDGFGFCLPTVGGRDASRELLKMFNRISRDDVRAWMLGGSVVSWFNIIDVNLLYAETGVPVACISYEDSEGIDKYIREYFPDDHQERIDLLKSMGERTKIALESGFDVYVLTAGMSTRSAKDLLNLFTLDGKVPEPIRVARLLSSTFREYRK